MKTSDMIRRLCEQMNISVSELARRLDQSPQNFGKKLKRETITLEELKTIADVMDVKFEQAFIPYCQIKFATLDSVYHVTLPVYPVI